MTPFPRNDSSIVGRWWWTVDRSLLGSYLLMAAIGVVLIAAASPPVARRIGLEDFHFVERHLVFLVVALVAMFAVSLLSARQVRRLAFLILGVSLLLLVATLLIGVEIKGARRWIHLPGLSIQPSEFVKPAFAVVAAWLFARAERAGDIPGRILATGLFGFVLALLVLQPDLGMAFVVAVMWFTQFFLAGMPILLVGLCAVLGAAGLFGAYLAFPHVQSRVTRFLNPEQGADRYQVEQSLQAFTNGGVFGTGPGHGTVKFNLPDAHADFVFAVAGEEFGTIFSVLIVLLFAFVVLRGFIRAASGESLFVLVAVAGLSVQIALQALINTGSSLDLIPTKGMTLPMMSYGGSSTLAIGLGLGMILALTRSSASTEGEP